MENLLFLFIIILTIGVAYLIIIHHKIIKILQNLTQILKSSFNLPISEISEKIGDATNQLIMKIDDTTSQVKIKLDEVTNIE